MGVVKINQDSVFKCVAQCLVHSKPLNVCVYACVCLCQDSNPSSSFPELLLHFPPPGDSVTSGQPVCLTKLSLCELGAGQEQKGGISWLSRGCLILSS